MKFGKQLRLGIFEPWRDYYIPYDKLKRIIKRRKFVADKEADKLLKQQKHAQTLTQIIADKFTALSKNPSTASNAVPNETTPLNPNSKASSFHTMDSDRDGKEAFDENLDLFPVLVAELNRINSFYIGKLAEMRISLEDITSSRNNSYRSHHTSSESASLLRLRDIYVDLAALRSYSELNHTGFYKIVKKYDKVMGENNLESWMKSIDNQPFVNTSEILTLMDIVTSLVSRDKLLEWERFATEQHSKSVDDIFPAVKPRGLLISLAIFGASVFAPMIIPNDPSASKCLSLLLFVISLWITEAIPYFATALLIPILVTVMGVLKDANGRPMNTEAASQFVMDHIFNHTTMLLLGGYTLSTAFSRCQLELRLAAMMHKRFGSSPKVFILAIMFLGLFLSMWISNHTAPILCATIILPIVRDLPTNSKFSKALLLGLAYACNFGGMMTPISSLQNVLAVSHLEQVGIEVSFGKWLCISVPFCVACTVVAWLLILFVVEPNDISNIPIVVYERDRAIFTRRNLTVMALSVMTIILFAFFNHSYNHIVKNTFGDLGIIALCFVSIMFGSGMLSEVDFNSLSWHTLFLVGGGNVLGKAIQSSGLLEYLSDGITLALPLSNVWLSFVIVLSFAGIVATFVSHTVAALILMPLIAMIGQTLGIPEALTIGAAFAVSGAMGLPFSSFPNVNSLLIVDDFQKPYLNVQDFLRSGMLLSVITIILIATLGYMLINLVTRATGQEFIPPIL